MEGITDNPGASARVGITNAHMPGNKSSFPPEFQTGTRLHYYSHLFNTVEVNSCFYKIPLSSTYEKWAKDVGPDFRFTLKLCKEITHARELDSDLSFIDLFMKAAEGVGFKKACILIQFPSKISLSHFNQLEKILAETKKMDPAHQWRLAVEFRNASWYTGETDELLKEFNASRVLHDFGKAKNFMPDAKADFLYLRFHGPKGDYRGSYCSDFLKTKVAEITAWINEGRDVYVYFNNTAGNAFENALELKKLLVASHCHA
jgi:uncharacterized protein YecE (DUF72 family)